MPSNFRVKKSSIAIPNDVPRRHGRVGHRWNALAHSLTHSNDANTTNTADFNFIVVRLM
jgi:hypothetical protein